MSIPTLQKARLGYYIQKQLIMGRRRFPLVLMLEPTFRCNLKCAGCGKIAYPKDVLNRRLTMDDCIRAAEECGAPVVSIPGGEPLLLPDIHRIVAELIVRKKFVYLCTNSVLLEKRLKDFTPSPYLTFNIHIDGLKDRHDALSGKAGVFETVVSAIRLLHSKGFRVTSNTTFYKGETPENAARLFDFLTSLGVEGMTVSPAFNYENKSSDETLFLNRSEVSAFFQQLFHIGKGRHWRFNHSRRYLQFLEGKQEYRCTPWANPTRNIFGWQRPCYLISDGYARSYRELMETTDWKRYGVGKDFRCLNCMVHCGYEPTAVIDTVKHPFRGFLKASERQASSDHAGGRTAFSKIRK